MYHYSAMTHLARAFTHKGTSQDALIHELGINPLITQLELEIIKASAYYLTLPHTSKARQLFQKLWQQKNIKSPPRMPKYLRSLAQHAALIDTKYSLGFSAIFGPSGNREPQQIIQAFEQITGTKMPEPSDKRPQMMRNSDPNYSLKNQILYAFKGYITNTLASKINLNWRQNLHERCKNEIANNFMLDHTPT